MGPTNLALVELFQADQALREAQARLDATTRNVRIQERRLADLTERLRLAQSKLKAEQVRSADLDLDIKSRDEHIEKLRAQQSTAHNNKEYQAFLIEINTQKVDKAKIEEESLKAMESVEKCSAEVKELTAAVESESAKLDQMRTEIGGKSAAMQAEVEALRGPCEEAAKAVPPRAREMFEKLSERYDGEALAKLERPDRRREEYLCSACNMTLVADVYNRLHNRDELVFCTSCRRILYIPDDLPVEAAVNKRKPQKKGGGLGPQIGAYIGRQSSAADVLKSMQVEEEQPKESDASASPESPAPPSPEENPS